MYCCTAGLHAVPPLVLSTRISSHECLRLAAATLRQCWSIAVRLALAVQRRAAGLEWGAAGLHSPKKLTSWSPCCGKLEQLLAQGDGAAGGCRTAAAFQDAAMAPGGATAGTLAAALQDRLLRRVDTPLFIVSGWRCAPLLLLHLVSACE
jgi:hypothetical protein